MRFAKITAAMAALAITFGGCKPEDAGHGGGSHDIKPKHGGSVVHLEDHGPCMEVVHDAKAGTIQLHMYDAHGDALKLKAAPIANIEKGPTQVTAKGEGDTWTFTHENLKEHPHVKFVVDVGGTKFNNDKWHAEGGH